MMTLDVIDTDFFMDMPLSTQALYFHLIARADDDGFLDNSKRIMKNCNAKQKDLDTLIDKGFLITFESGICVITHWKVHNYVRSDRYKETLYTNEKSQLKEDINGIYRVGIPNDNHMTYRRDTQVRLGKVSIDKDNIYIPDIPKKYIDLSFIDTVIKIDKVKLTQEEYDKLTSKFGKELVNENILSLDNYIVNGKGNRYKDHYRVLNTWCNKSQETYRNNSGESKLSREQIAELEKGRKI